MKWLSNHFIDRRPIGRSFSRRRNSSLHFLQITQEAAQGFRCQERMMSDSFLGARRDGESITAFTMRRLMNEMIETCAKELERAHDECATLNLLHGAARIRALKDDQS